MKDAILRLWRGDLPLGHVFWNYAVIYGTFLNVATTMAALGALVAGLPVALVLGIFFLPLPYNITVVVGVWRSAANYSGPQHWAVLARITVTVWAIVATVL
jgi:hypothetical protein